MTSAVSRPAAADSTRASRHFESLLEFETDCWDVHHAIKNDRKDFILLDVRGEESYSQGHIEGAMLLPVQELEDRLDELPLKKPLTVYCRSGSRSRTAAEILVANGFIMVYDPYTHRGYSGLLDEIPSGF